MTRSAVIDNVTRHFDSGLFRDDLARRVAFRTESANPELRDELNRYLTADVIPAVEALGFSTRIVENPVDGAPPFLVARRVEDDAYGTVLTYGHGDVQPAHPDEWRAGLTPWELVEEGDRWYGRGTADNKGQHTVNLTALDHVLRARDGRLGYNVTLLMDMGEESGSPGLVEVCSQLREELAADLLVASDGPRVSAEEPTMFLGSRGSVNLTLRVDAREGAFHSGNWGGLLSNPATVLSNAIASMVDGTGRLLVDGLRPEHIPDSVREALSELNLGEGTEDARIDPDWGEPGLTPNERVIAWNTMEVLAMTAGNPDAPVNAIPPRARATLQLRFVVGLRPEEVGPIVQRHLEEAGFPMVRVSVDHTMAATRLAPDDPWVTWTARSLEQTTGKRTAVLPNLGGSLPNEAFADVLGVPTVWIPHSYPGCAQHAPNEHTLASLNREALAMMAGVFWDLGEPDPWESATATL